jgi:tetratricopeptide (TPR) repeat protein
MEGVVRKPIGIIALTALLLQACATGTGDRVQEDATAPVAPAYVPAEGLSDKERFREALYLLEDGDPIAARAELVLYLQNQPGSEVATDLLEQIDLPADSYFPAEYREITLHSGVSLSNLSEQYLGSVYKFHALARYNGIAEPRKLSAGQVIRIPLTDEAQLAFALEDKGQSGVTVASEKAPVAEGAAPEKATPARAAPKETAEAKVERLHREALNAYRAQDLDKAIGLWDQVLELDPEHENARLYRSQAIDLKKKLSNLN